MALITAAQARIFQPHLSGTGEDTDLNTMISYVGARFARWCNIPPASTGATPTLESASYTLYSGLTCWLSEDFREIRTPAIVTAVSSIYQDPNWEYGAATLVSSSDYTLFGDQRIIALKPLAALGEWDSSKLAVKVACTMGFVTVPEDLKIAAALQTRLWWDRRPPKADQNPKTFDPSIDLPVLEMLTPFKNFRSRGS